MRLAVPAAWEIVRHAVSVQAGRLVFVDRRTERLNLCWRALPSEPDLGHMLDDYRQRDRQMHADAAFKDTPAVNGWQGTRRVRGGRMLSRMVRYEPGAGRLVEMIVPWPQAYEADLERALLESFQMLGGLEGPQRISAFGLDVRVPAPWMLKRASVQVAKACLEFTAGRRRGRVTRWGAADDWYDGQPEAFVEGQLRGEAAEFQPAWLKAHAGCAARSKEPGPRWRRLAGRQRERRDLVWLCPVDHALYQVTTLFPADQPVPPETFAVGCCRAQEVPE